MQAELVPLAERHHGADDEYPPRAVIEMRSRPDLAPGVTGDEIDEVGVERILALDRFIDPGITQHLAALRHAVIVAFLVVHRDFLPSLRAKRSNPVRIKILDCFVAYAPRNDVASI